MTLICQHRVNDPAQLRDVPAEYGVEIDLRSWGDQLHLAHDAFVRGPSFDEWLDAYGHAFIVVNIKEEGLEQRIAETLLQRGITDWAFLDQSFPFLVRRLRSGPRNAMVRVSEFERPDTAIALTPRPDWVWLDSFDGTAPDPAMLARLSARGYRLMVVAPELQGRDPVGESDAIRHAFDEAGAPLDGVCTKRPDLWLP